ncbi:hypothetical protein Ocin01_07237 [Orchesella cincta]|uniref:Uncharacterized protein n=1 Tax=Orchesella cincta TaxID=48709 RepID=A0A1D2N2G5_ORCCI|nr:hypothetical protein Ocin01_07237 [Orchesella cincta]
MVFRSIILKASSLLFSFFSLVIPIVEDVALKFRFNRCDCCYPTRVKSQNGHCLKSNKGKKRSRNQYSPATKTNGTSATTTVEHYSYGSEVKRIKLLLDITMSEGTQPQVLNIQASAAPDERCNACSEHCEKKQWFIWKFINMPSSILLYVTSKLWELVHSLELALDMDQDQHNVEDSNRIKKSPKRRITRANYRKILPFFPFNLLGFSNYSAFQMPSITRSPEKTNNLNVSVNGNGKARSKRRRHSSTDEDASSISENDRSKVLNDTHGAGHDEVDSDETADTVTKQVSSSSSSSEPSSSNKFVIVPECENSSTAVEEGEEVEVVSSVLEELNKAANEDYRSDEDPDYKPVESTSEDTSFNTDSGASDESMLAEMGVSTSSGGASSRKPKPNPVPEAESDLLPSSSTVNPHHLDIGSVSTGCDDDYKTPDEEDDDKPKKFSEPS